MDSKKTIDEEERETQSHLLQAEKYALDEQACESQSSGTSEESEAPKRGNWASQIEFILACVGFSVAYGNIMRFPYLCMRNGGGELKYKFPNHLSVCLSHSLSLSLI